MERLETLEIQSLKDHIKVLEGVLRQEGLEDKVRARVAFGSFVE